METVRVLYFVTAEKSAFPAFEALTVHVPLPEATVSVGGVSVVSVHAVESAVTE